MRSNYKNKNSFQNTKQSKNFMPTAKHSKKSCLDNNLSNNKIDSYSQGIEKIQSKFAMLFLIKRTICPWSFSTLERQFNGILDRSQKYYNTRLYVLTYIKLLDDFDKIKSLVFNKNLNISHFFTKKPHVKNLEGLELI